MYNNHFANSKRRLSVLFLLILTILSLAVAALTVHPTSSALPDKVIAVSYAAGGSSGTAVLPEPSAGEDGTVWGLKVSDQNRIWHTRTDVDIFDHQDPRVKSDGSGQAPHIIAPGTANDYVFSLQNNENNWYEYVVKIQAGENSALALPVEVRIFAPDGSALTGDRWIPIGEIGTLTHAGQLKTNRSAQYMIEWKWVFDAGQDVYDTQLGNAAVDEELSCFINIELAAQYVLDDNGNPKTGDDVQLWIYWVMTGVSSLVILCILLIWKKKSDKERTQTAGG